MIHERLKQAREARGLELEALAGRIGVRARWLEQIEAGAFGDLPAGVYGRSAVRAYAMAMAIDPDEAVAEVGHLLARPEDPLDGLARVKGHKRRPSPREDETSAAAVTGSTIDVEPASRPTAAGPDLSLASPQPTRVSPNEGPRLTWASTRADWWRPALASAVDGALLGAIELILIYLTVLACGTGVGPTLRVAGPAMAGLFLLIAGLYFVLLGGVRNQTLGTRVAGLRRAPTTGVALDLRAVFTRACHCFSRQMPAAVEWRAAEDSVAERWRRIMGLNRV